MIISSTPEPKLPDFNARFNVPLETLPVTLYPPKPTDPRLVMVFSSILYDVNYPKSDAIGTPESGASLIASIAHKYRIPVTWLASPKMCLRMKDVLTKWHEEYGDTVAPFEWKNVGPLKAALPWASPTVCFAATVASESFRQRGTRSFPSMLRKWSINFA